MTSEGSLFVGWDPGGWSVGLSYSSLFRAGSGHEYRFPSGGNFLPLPHLKKNVDSVISGLVVDLIGPFP